MAAPAPQTASEQLGLYGAGPGILALTTMTSRVRSIGLCKGCRIREGRYGFRKGQATERRGTLCFHCFHSELGRRQDVVERQRQGWNAIQTGLPLANTLDELQTRRRRAQIAARHALDEPTLAVRAKSKRIV